MTRLLALVWMLAVASTAAMTSAAPTKPQTMTVAQLSDLTGIKEGTLRQWRRRGMRPHGFKAHGVVLYRVAEVEAWLAESEAETNAAGRPA